MKSKSIYPLPNLVLLFFLFCIMGWGWEVVVKFYQHKTFINSGFLHGCWLPIYGIGGMILLLALYRFKETPQLVFGLGFLLSGVLEYTCGWLLETLFNAKWWDYSSEILNIHGRVSAVGLLVFALAGCFIVYKFAPWGNQILNRVPTTARIILCIVLIFVFTIDVVISLQHPNVGTGISSAVMTDTLV